MNYTYRIARGVWAMEKPKKEIERDNIYVRDMRLHGKNGTTKYLLKKYGYLDKEDKG